MFSNITRLLAVAALALVLPAGAIWAGEEAAASAPSAVVGIKISFKVAPRGTRGRSEGYRWVSLATYASSYLEKEPVIEGRARGIDLSGKPTAIVPKWTPSDSGMVTVSPSEGQEVKITVHHAGESIVKVDCGGVSKALLIKVSSKNNVTQVMITQVNSLATPHAAVAKPPMPPAAVPPAIKVLFLLDPRVTRGMYMGDRWVSPPTYTAVQAGSEATVEAIAQLAAPGGRLMDISPRWTPSDSQMLTVLPNQGHRVKITVRCAGESRLRVESEGLSRELLVRASVKDQAMHVEITQQPAPSGSGAP